MTPSLRKSIELLQLSKFELLEEIKHHQDENPFIKNINETKEFFELDKIKIYPNPTSDRLFINTNLNDYKINIYNSFFF